ncbi:MAG: hypothetical protein KatS3mg057_1299 [Herpetosiphonaceae bacterium]|nr:MAG: hypothetical protein KatS3mg057_1299 [Herpetosiphonaceae bacterium]
MQAPGNRELKQQGSKNRTIAQSQDDDSVWQPLVWLRSALRGQRKGGYWVMQPDGRIIRGRGKI